MLPNVRRQSARLTREQSTHDSIVHVLDNIVHAIEASVLPGVLASSGNSPAAVARRDAIANVGLQSFLQIAKTPRSTPKTKTPTTRNLASCIQGYFSTTYILVYLRTYISSHRGVGCLYWWRWWERWCSLARRSETSGNCHKDTSITSAQFSTRSWATCIAWRSTIPTFYA